MMRKVLIFTAIFCILLFGTACQADQTAQPEAPPVTDETVSPAADQPLPAEEAPAEAAQQPAFPTAFSTADIYGNAVDESFFAAYDLTMLNIWGTYCGPCIMEMPDLGEMSAEMPPGTQLVGLVSDGLSMEYIELARSIVEETGAAFTHLIPDVELFTYVYDNIVGVPTTVFIDAQGNLVGEPLIGARARLVYEAELEQRLEQIKGESAEDAEEAS